MKKLIYLLFITSAVFAQNTKQLTYQYTDHNDFVCESHLFLKGKESLYIIKDPRMELNNQSTSGLVYKLYNDKWSRIFYKSEKLNITRVPLYGREMVYNSDKLVQSVKLTDKTKKIAGYTCQEALVSKGGRKYAVWYTTDVALVASPLNLSAVPGLVVELRDTGSENFKITLQKISNTADLKEFEKYKKYILEKPIKSYVTYEKDLISQMSNIKKENYAALAKFNASVEYAADQSYFTVHVVDIPEKLVPALQKITK